MIIGVSGKSGSGKDTIGDYLSENYDYHKVAFASQVKSACSILFDIPMEHFYNQHLKNAKIKYNKTPRELMQLFATDFIRDKIDPDFWIDKLMQYLEEDDKVVICDVRFQNEIDKILEKGGYIIKVVRDDVMFDPHPSEAVPEYCDFVLQNNSSKQDLFDQVESVVKNISQE